MADIQLTHETLEQQQQQALQQGQGQEQQQQQQAEIDPYENPEMVLPTVRNYYNY